MFTVPVSSFHIGFLKLHAYGLCLFVAALILFARLFYFSRAVSWSLESFIDFYLSEFVSALIGARLLFILKYGLDGDHFSWWSLLFGGFSFVGAIIALPITLLLWSRYKKVSFWALLDDVAAELPLFDGIVRLGCFFGGCCYGVVSQVCSVVYLDELAQAPCGISLFPVQLLTSILSFALFFLVTYLRNKKEQLPEGSLSAIYFVGACFIRGAIDFFRFNRGAVFCQSPLGFISAHQFWCFILSLFGVAFSVWILKNNKNRS